MEIHAPLSGIAVPLAEVPDEVFAQLLVGDGLAIDPTSSQVLAPIGGTISQLHQARHALAITSVEGVEVLIHVGLDTVTLKGHGFTSLAKLGDVVVPGQPLIRFDADVVGRAARSLITVVVVTNLKDGQRLMPTKAREVVAGSSVLLTLELAGARATRSPSPAVAARGVTIAAAPSVTTGTVVRSAPIVLPNPSGLHARPAAVLAQQAKHFVSTVRLFRGTASANLKSVVSVMGLSTHQGDAVVVEASGADATEAIAALSKTLREGSGEASMAPLPAVVPVVKRASSRSGVFEGVSASPGLVLGRVVGLGSTAPSFAEVGGPVPDELRKLDAAIVTASAQLAALAAQEGGPRADILNVQRELLEDPEILARTRGVVWQGKSAAFAWNDAFRAQAANLEQLDQPLLRERAVDVRDVGLRLLKVLTGDTAGFGELPENAIVVTAELTPTQLASFPKDRFKGLVTTTGSATSHVAILARGMGVPAVMGVDERVLALAEGLEVVLDGAAGWLELAPAPGDLVARGKLNEQIARLAEERKRDQAAALNVGQTRDGRRIEVVANIKNLDDAREAIAGGAEGIGLLRSEFLFYDRDSAPDEDEQRLVYRAIAEVVGPDRPLVVRTLDVGGDKPLPYLALPREGNPFLGLRGIRVSLDQPQLFRIQLRAILSAAGLTRLHIMFPMISGMEELRAARQMLAEEQRALDVRAQVKVGIMIEVPSAVVMAEALAREVDFFSIGTNDLTQYALAMDRGHPQLASRADALHPAVLKLIAATVDGARVHQRPVHLCGGIASDPLAAPLLVGLGVTELSVSTSSVGPVKAALARWPFSECEELATDVLRQTTTAEVRALLKSWQPGRLRSAPALAVGG
ncbi:MAG: phosphoenolpyruvate--protein phosphotransferase [Archangium sp.]|nr:phosphoenolpyruvate--protein phosphotransferase [Archangium sp.]